MDRRLIFELERPKFNRSRLRVYYGNMGEIIAQEVLRRQGFEVWLARLVGSPQDFLRVFHMPEMDEELKGLRRHYDNLPSFRREEETWKKFLERQENHLRSRIESAKANRAFFGEQLDAFKEYMKRLKSDSIKYYCDLVAKKDTKIYLVEVKSTKGARKLLKGEKLRGLVLAREYGFIPSIVSFSLKIEAKDFQMEEYKVSD